MMENIALTRLPKHDGPPLYLKETATTASRGWEAHSAVRTLLFMWRLRLAYFPGGDPGRLARRYDRS